MFTRKINVLIYIGIFILAFIVRLVFVIIYPPQHFFADELNYDKLGVEISNSLFATSYTPYDPNAQVYPYTHFGLARPPLYPIWIASLYALFGQSLTLVRIGNALLGGFAVLLTALLAKRLGGNRAGYIAGIFMVFYPIHVYISRTLLVENLATPLFILSFFAGLLAVERRGILWGAVCGIAGGLSALAKANLIVLIPVLALGMGISILREGYRKRAMLIIMVVILATAFTILPRFIDNGLRYDIWTPLTTTTWMNIWLGFNEYVDAFEHKLVTNQPQMEEKAAQFIGDDTKVEDFYKQEALKYILKNPSRSAYLYFGRLISFFDYRTKIRDQHFKYAFLKDMANLITYGAVFILTGIGLAFKNIRRKGFPLYVVIGVIPFSLAVFNISIRYRIPIEPLMVVLGTTTLLVIFDRVKLKWHKRKVNK